MWSGGPQGTNRPSRRRDQRNQQDWLANPVRSSRLIIIYARDGNSGIISTPCSRRDRSSRLDTELQARDGAGVRWTPVSTDRAEGETSNVRGPPGSVDTKRTSLNGMSSLYSIERETGLEFWEWPKS